MRKTISVSTLLFAVPCALALAHCSSLTSVCEGAACGSTTDGGSDGATSDGGQVDAPEGCDPKADVKDAPKCVVNEFGVFVDAAGSNDNPGTKEKPVKTITAALGK